MSCHSSHPSDAASRSTCWPWDTARWPPDRALRCPIRSAEGIGGLTYTDPSRLSDLTIDTYFGPLVATEERRRLIDAYASALEPNPLAGLEAALRECDIPTRIVWGTGDVTFSAADPTYLDRILPRSRGVREVADAKLFFPEEYPDLIAEEARALWHA